MDWKKKLRSVTSACGCQPVAYEYDKNLHLQDWPCRLSHQGAPGFQHRAAEYLSSK
jgi:hypothetical protein